FSYLRCDIMEVPMKKARCASCQAPLSASRSAIARGSAHCPRCGRVRSPGQVGGTTPAEAPGWIQPRPSAACRATQVAPATHGCRSQHGRAVAVLVGGAVLFFGAGAALFSWRLTGETPANVAVTRREPNATLSQQGVMPALPFGARTAPLSEPKKSGKEAAAL